MKCIFMPCVSNANIIRYFYIKTYSHINCKEQIYTQYKSRKMNTDH